MITGSSRLIKLSSLIDKSEINLLSESLIANNPWKKLGYLKETFLGYFTKEDSALKRLGIYHNSQLVGTVCIRQPWLRGPFIELFFILPEFHGKKIGSSSINVLIESEYLKNSKNLWVSCAEFNSEALNFYKKNGFVVIGNIPDLIKAGEIEILLRKKLD